MADQHMQESLTDEQADALLDNDEVEETIEQDDDAQMDSGDEGEDIDLDGAEETIQLQNDSVAHFDLHKDSVYCIAQHPTHPEIVATGGGDDTAYVWSAAPADDGEGPVLPQSYESNPQPRERKGQEAIAKLAEQDETVNAITFTLPAGDFIATGTLAGKLNVYATPTQTQPTAKLVGSAKEVEEINWLLPCPHKSYPNTIALGANDGSVWVYTIDPSDSSSPLSIVQTFFLHQAPCTAGAWTPDGKLLATVAEDSSLYVWDVFGEAAAAGVTDPMGGGQAVVALGAEDERFKVDGGLYSVAVSPGGGIVAVGGAEGHVRVVGLPRFSAAPTTGAKGAGAKSKAGGSKQAPAPSTASAGQAGQLLASVQAQADGIETLSFSQPPLTLLAAGSVDGSIAVFDAAHNFAVRRHIPSAHQGAEDEDDAQHAVIQVEFVKTPLGTPNPRGYVLTSCGNDGVVRRWDVRGGTTEAGKGKGLMGEWRGHRGGGEGGGILGFVQGGGGARIVTAGDDGVGLVFNTP
ncbi:60S ribosomal subunit assembly or modification protein [Elasticomyces elasticus]|uniref:60S ribosomal subunit assembly or modification protein n=1 Tax=Elasticomyces elasticus TaxID=574655 RepID=A0AAN7VXX6_9PEZI|nr:60S ribosomal subunit assembly or modification protein [Elasticomyces elasticus]